MFFKKLQYYQFRLHRMWMMMMKRRFKDNFFKFRHREIRRQMSHSQAIQGLTLKPDVLVDDNDINDREVIYYYYC